MQYSERTGSSGVPGLPPVSSTYAHFANWSTTALLATSRINPEIEFLSPRGNGLPYRHRDMDSFAQAMDHVLSNLAERVMWRQRSLDTVSRPGGFNLETMVSGYADALRACATSVRRG